jgi:hypothetical protein
MGIKRIRVAFGTTNALSRCCMMTAGATAIAIGKTLPLSPAHCSGFARWPRTRHGIAEVARSADQPQRLHHLVAMIEDTRQAVAAGRVFLTCGTPACRPRGACSARVRREQMADGRFVSAPEAPGLIGA